ncbi:MAG: hypothetical protein FWH56_12910 [Betaproteobacteria bacterium]|nr:hypothetical protein [Betaproteobacteria bacterium]
MESRKVTRAVLATLVVACACFSTPASARHGNGHLARDILLAPLLLPAAILAASTPHPVVYHETYYYGGPNRYATHHRYAPRHDVRRYESHRGYGRQGGYSRRYR